MACGFDLADLFRSRPPLREWTRRDLNPRPPGCKPGALPAELRARCALRRDAHVALVEFRHARDRLDTTVNRPGRFCARSARWPTDVLRPWQRHKEAMRNNIGGDPSAGSPTDTLLRLNPACEIEVQARQETCLHYDPTRMV